MTILMVILAASMPLEIEIVGRLMVADLVCVFVLLVAIVTHKIPPLLRSERTFYHLILLWFIAQVLTDIYLEVPFSQYSRGWAKIVFFAINFSAIRVLVRGDIKKSISLLILIFIGAAYKFYIGTGNIEKTGMLSVDWKFGYGTAFTALMMFLAAQLSRSSSVSRGSFLLVFGAAAVNLAMNARSLFGETALAALIGITLGTSGKTRLSTLTLFVLGAISVGGGLAAVQVYSYVASEGLIGQSAQQKYERQADNDLGLLLGGRTELLGSLDAIADSPIVGYGSYAKNTYYAELRVIRLRQAGVLTPRDLKDYRIPTHSFLFGAWVEAGIMGALFWLWALYSTGRGIVFCIQRPSHYTTLIIFAGISLAWDILFSPFGLDRRIVTPALLSVILLVGADEPKHMTSQNRSTHDGRPSTPRQQKAVPGT